MILGWHLLLNFFTKSTILLKGFFLTLLLILCSFKSCDQVKVISTNLEIQHKISSGDIINKCVILYCVNLCELPINVLALFLHVIIKLQSSALCTLSFKYYN